ncbi:MAG: TIGR01212 family radical SAM protein [Clostridium sp.]|nr:TIGR01212 family radical SAM protein [Clostridium sp.]MCM1398639.1 TIGR01212 family radical SAM protein [Clostridium sp.]MCM1459925.1 TIGR01212 family radical SAM protein [Bacteroides sp.]
MKNVDWGGKPYYSLNAYFKHTYGTKCHKLAVDAGFTCPNRDGRLDVRGCVFCSAGGSGDFAVGLADALLSIDELTEKNIVIYFQAFTNTYGDVNDMRRLFTSALCHERVIGISIATRPDCLGADVLLLLEELKNRFTQKFIWIELGLQTIHRKTEQYIRRHYGLEAYEAAVKNLKLLQIPFITHIILGLPGENEAMMLETVKYVSDISCITNRGPNGIKLQLLHVLAGTDMADDYKAGRFQVLGQAEYIDLAIKCLQNTDETIVIHRITGDGPKKILIAPEWSANKRAVLNAFHKRMKELGARQGDAIKS